MVSRYNTQSSKNFWYPYSIKFSTSTASTPTEGTVSKFPGLLDDVFNSLQGVMGKIHGINLGNNIINHGINLGDNIILRIHFKNYSYNSFIFFHLIYL